MTARLFFAIPLPEPAKELFVAEQRTLLARARPSLGLRLIGGAQLHLTLKFVGDVSDERVPEFAALVAEQASLVPELRATFSAVTGFPSERRAGVIVALLDERTGELAELAARLEAAATGLGVARERRVFRAHATLARLRHPADVRALLPKHAAATLGVERELCLSELCLYRSTLSPRGSIYEALACSAFAGQSTSDPARTGRPINA